MLERKARLVRTVTCHPSPFACRPARTHKSRAEREAFFAAKSGLRTKLSNDCQLTVSSPPGWGEGTAG